MNQITSYNEEDVNDWIIAREESGNYSACPMYNYRCDISDCESHNIYVSFFSYISEENDGNPTIKGFMVYTCLNHLPLVMFNKVKEKCNPQDIDTMESH